MEAKRRRVEHSEPIPTDEVKYGQRSAKCVSEEDVGITEFVNPTSLGFSGLIKQRYSDFQVNEITNGGEVLQLKHIEEPEKKEQQEEVVQTAPKVEISPNEHTQKLAQLTSQEFVDKCFDMLNDPQAPTARTEVISDKPLRSEIHGLVREGFGSHLESRTDDNRIAVLKLAKRGRKNKNGVSTRGGRTPRQGEYLHFTLYKENKETMEALSMISKFMHIPPKLITFAGTKDRRAATTQRACWRRGNPQRLAGLNGAFKAGNIRLGDFAFEDYTIRLGDLSGNQFGIVIRATNPESHKNIDDSLSSLRDHGFINYFGLQRFGTFSTSSHTTGKAILREDYQAAVDGILRPQDVTIAESKDARDVWIKTGDAAKTLELMPKRCVAETSILNALLESPNPLNALLRIPYSLKTMYVHAYQSYIWNRAASERISRSRTHALVGDLVFGSVNERGIQEAHKISTEEEASKYSIFDVILPLPGNDITYPDNMVAFYEDLMAEDGINCHDMVRKIKEFSVFGSYRTLLAKPMFLKWYSRKYVGKDATILYTDKEALEFGEKLAPEMTVEKLETKCNENGEVLADEDRTQKTAIVLTMGLSTSQYATMALREAMKKETSRNGDIYFG